MTDAGQLRFRSVFTILDEPGRVLSSTVRIEYLLPRDDATKRILLEEVQR